MTKAKIFFVCQSCGSQASKWAGQCGDCGAWNTISEEPASISSPTSKNRFSGYAAATDNQVTLLSEVTLNETPRLSCGLSELDHVLGGGLVTGSVVLIGGDPGIGKSTLLLQTMAELSQQLKVLYVSGEESLQQVRLRAQRLRLPEEKLLILAETQIEKIIATAEKEKPQVMVVDSIQTVFTDLLQTAPGAVGQLRESTAQLVRFAKQTNIAIFLVGHVTKEGTLAGPRVLEHMVDTVLYFEGRTDSRFRMLRAVKNRFGAVNELGVFAMTENGLKGISNPSAIFLQNQQQAVSGSAVIVSWEGSRPLLIELQALVDESHLGNPRRVALGLDHNRLAMLLAVLHRHGGVASYNQDVFINVVGGVKVTETAADLGLLFAVISSLRDRPLPNDLIVFGEVGLAGEIRPVQSGQERLREAEKIGFKKAIIPKGNASQKFSGELEIMPVATLEEALQWI